jgi:hypothetical protein
VPKEIHSSRLLPGLDDDEVDAPPFPFTRFERQMSISYLAHIRDPAETTYPFTDWSSRRVPHWRWAGAHHFFHAKRFCWCDDETDMAHRLLRSRTGEYELAPWIKPLVDAVLIHERNDRLRWLLESHLLLPEPPPNLAAKLGLRPITIRHYESLFFDVRDRLSASAWINAHALGGCAWNGFADEDLAPIWRRMAYYTASERILDITVAVTTGVGRERFPEEECEEVQLWIEDMRLSPLLERDRTQIDRRLRAEANGEPPSSYHRPRKTKGLRTPVRDSPVIPSAAAPG